jgi:hypothetical protein
MRGEIREVYTELGQVLDAPWAFGLGQHVPQPLADRLESMRRMLEEAAREQGPVSPDDDLASELSQDADRNSLLRRIKTSTHDGSHNFRVGCRYAAIPE